MKTRKTPTRTPASQVMRSLTAVERLWTKLPPDERQRFERLVKALFEQPTLFKGEQP